MSAGKLTEAELARIRIGVDKDECCSCHEDNDTSHTFRVVEAILAEREASLRGQIAADIEAKYLGPDFGRQYDGRESPTAALQNAYDEGLEVAARIVRTTEEER